VVDLGEITSYPGLEDIGSKILKCEVVKKVVNPDRKLNQNATTI
jgi:hypothetical protein